MASRPATTVERTYVPFYVPDVHGARGHDQVVLKHPNGLCVVCLSPEHPMCAAAGSSIALSASGVRRRAAGVQGKPRHARSAPTGASGRGRTGVRPVTLNAAAEPASSASTASLAIW